MPLIFKFRVWRFGESIFYIGCWRFVPRPCNAFTHWAHVNWSVNLNKLDQLVFPPLFAWSWQNFKSSKSLVSYKKFCHDQGFMMTQISNLDSKMILKVRNPFNVFLKCYSVTLLLSEIYRPCLALSYSFCAVQTMKYPSLIVTKAQLKS